MGARVIGIGQPAAGDDGVGLAVLKELRCCGVPAGVEMYEITEPTRMMPLLETHETVIIVDAIVGGKAPGVVLNLSLEAFEQETLTPVSSHGLGVIDVIRMARTLEPERVSSQIRVVGVVIARPQRYRQGLSPEVAQAVPQAVKEVLSLLGG